MDFSTILEGVKSVLPTLKFVASLTPTTIDDLVVQWLDVLVNDPKKAFDEVLGENGDKIRTGLSGLLPYFSSLANHWPSLKPVVDFLSYLVTDHVSAIASVGF